MISLLAAVFIAASPCRTALADADAVIVAVSGAVQVRPASEKKFIKAEAGFPIAYGDRIRTGRRAIVHIEFPDGTEVLVKEGADFTLQAAPRKRWVSFSVGEFLVGLKRSLESGESFEVRTPSAVASVRGTLFWGQSDRNKNSVWAGFGHKVAIRASGKTVVLEPGQTVRVAFSGAPGPAEPSTVSKAFISTFALAGDLRGVDQLVDASLK